MPEKILSIPFGKGEKKPPVCMSTDAIKQLLAAIDSSVDEGLRHLALYRLCTIQLAGFRKSLVIMLWISILANAAGFMSVERETNIV